MSDPEPKWIPQVGYLYTCSICGATVHLHYRDTHSAWHSKANR